MQITSCKNVLLRPEINKIENTQTQIDEFNKGAFSEIQFSVHDCTGSFRVGCVPVQKPKECLKISF